MGHTKTTKRSDTMGSSYAPKGWEHWERAGKRRLDMTRQIHHCLMKTLGAALAAVTLLCGTSLAAASEFKSKKLVGALASNTMLLLLKFR